MLCWSIDIGRSNVAIELSLLSRNLDMPLHGHLYQALKAFSYLKHHHNYNVVMDPECMYLGEQFKSRFKSDADWFEFYSDSMEKITINAATHYGNYVVVNTLVD